MEGENNMETVFTSANFDADVLGSEIPVVVDFFATWCGPCRMMAPVIEELAEEYDGKVKIGKLDVDENSDIAARYGVMSIPTIILFKNGEVFSKSVGLQDKEVLENAAKEKNVTINVSGDDIKLRGVRSLLYEIVYNLCENGIKYNKDGGRVDITLSKEAEKNIIVIEDTGIGIKEEQQSRIFERFYRVDKARSRETGGTGLGLALTRRAILLHRGSIKVYSKEKEGTTFTIRIPLNYVTAEN